MLSKSLFLLSLVASINAIPVPNPQTPNADTLQTCEVNGAIVCSPDGGSFYLCNFSRAVPMGKVAAGTKCMGGKIVTLGASEMPTPEPQPQPTMPSYVAEPTTAELVKTTAPPEMPTKAPEPDEITTTIIETSEVLITSTSVIVTTVTGKPPVDAPSSAPAPEPTASPPITGKITVTEDIILKIGPPAKSCPRPGAERGLEECVTAAYAVPFINEAFAEYEINTIGEAAAILSLMMFETADFQYNRNHFGGLNRTGNPGQGTRNMMSPPFILQYAQTFGSTDNIKPGLTPETFNAESDEVKNKVLATVLGDDRTWASGAWFYKTHEPCKAVMAGLQKSPNISTAAWEAYITGCIDTTLGDRLDRFKLAVTAFGGTLVA